MKHLRAQLKFIYRVINISEKILIMLVTFKKTILQKHHKNRNQCVFFNHYVAQEAIALPILALASLSVFSHDEDLRATSRVFAIGMPFVLIAKDIIKQLRFTCNQR